jgi:hypothetical protein
MVHSPFSAEYTKTGSGALGAVSIGKAIGRRSETPVSAKLVFVLLKRGHPAGTSLCCGRARLRLRRHSGLFLPGPPAWLTFEAHSESTRQIERAIGTAE